MDYKKAAEEMFSGDRYAKLTGITIDEVRPGYSKCSFAVGPEHMNASGSVMGGATFTLADFAFAVAANAGEERTVSLESKMNFLRPAVCKTLIAEAKVVKSGSRTCLYTVEVFDENGNEIAFSTMTGFKVGGKI